MPTNSVSKFQFKFCNQFNTCRLKSNSFQLSFFLIAGTGDEDTNRADSSVDGVAEKLEEQHLCENDGKTGK